MSILDALETGLKQLYASRHTQSSAMTLTVFDYLLTFPAEVEYFWTGKWSIPRVLFFLNRYTSLFWQAFDTAAVFAPARSVEFCQGWGHRFLPAAGTTAIAIVHLILALRAWSLYSQSPLVGAILVVAFLATLSGEIYVDIKFIPNFTRIEVTPGDWICFPLGTTQTSVFFVPVIMFDSLVFLLVIGQAVNRWTSNRTTGVRSSSLYKTLVRDSVGYFFVVLIVYIVEAIAWVVFPIALRFLLQGYTLAAISTMGTRLLLNLRIHSGRPSEFEDIPLSTMKFGDREPTSTSREEG